MGGLDWSTIGEHYRAFLPYVAHRNDLNYVIADPPRKPPRPPYKVHAGLR